LEITVLSHETKFIYRGKKNLKKRISRFIKHIGTPNAVLTIIITNDFNLKLINEKYLGKDYFTDVISLDYSTEDIISGDIFVSIDRVRKNSKIFKEKLYNELDRVIIHGILHLMGYNDRNKSEKKIMTYMENKFLELRMTKK